MISWFEFFVFYYNNYYFFTEFTTSCKSQFLSSLYVFLGMGLKGSKAEGQGSESGVLSFAWRQLGDTFSKGSPSISSSLAKTATLHLPRSPEQFPLTFC